MESTENSGNGNDVLHDLIARTEDLDTFLFLTFSDNASG
jgi:hypothetical protein